MGNSYTAVIIVDLSTILLSLQLEQSNLPQYNFAMVELATGTLQQASTS